MFWYYFVSLFNFVIMKFKKLALDFYRALSKLPNWGKVMALASVASLFCAIHPVVKPINDLTYNHNRLYVNEKGKLDLYLYPSVSKEFPNEYININRKPCAGDNVVILRERLNPKGEIFMFYNPRVSGGTAWKKCLNSYLKNRQRKKMALSFVFSASLCLGSFPGLIKRMLELIPRK